ncbi:VOC family protein [Neorhodopirellula pilleata]|uniref:Glyoxalase-like domain protein n=1 Tax=Neorhodopirellula pilleata TaxID=2714738 RepID=A0A5C6A8F9_9BACT|nr:VOC family protein [Neorhodopirellula pilleata]TWT95585.1 Glyoxalase-like domain protein [Neorhodopirellula pilleata]
MNRNPVGWFEIYVQDMKRAKAFYETVLAVELTELASPDPELEMQAFPMDMEAGGASGALARMEGCPSGGMGTLVYFSCEDCATEASRVEAAGGKICKPKMAIGQYGFIALVSDTEGNMVGLHSLQ